MEPVNKHKRTMHLLFGKQRPGRGENAGKNAGKCGKKRIAFISPPRYREAQLIHARGATLGTLGCLTPEILVKYSGDQFDGPIKF